MPSPHPEPTRVRQAAIAFGPVPSRRLGRSIGINNIPPKVCSYACIYCQVGATPSPQVEPRPIYPPEEVAAHVVTHVAKVRARGERIDYLTFVPDGEPTLDAGLARSIELLRPLGIPIAVISNGSLAWRAEVREALRLADWVSVKVDTVDEATWQRLNRPAAQLRLATVLDGIRMLADGFPGRLASETMLVAAVNDGPAGVSRVGAFLREIGVSTSYLAIPTRPPAVATAHAPDEETVIRAYEVMSETVADVELLIGYEGDAFAASGDPRADLLAITAVHPLRESAVRDLLERSNADWSVVEGLERDGEIRAVEYAGSRF
ncbi:MAG TPA: radical SAM protein, partial [Gaiellaceae bacterium]|nr:radical SAM protein [Gaiellaceae bacterium]